MGHARQPSGPALPPLAHQLPPPPQQQTLTSSRARPSSTGSLAMPLMVAGSSCTRRTGQAGGRLALPTHTAAWMSHSEPRQSAAAANQSSCTHTLVKERPERPASRSDSARTMDESRRRAGRLDRCSVGDDGRAGRQGMDARRWRLQQLAAAAQRPSRLGGRRRMWRSAPPLHWALTSLVLCQLPQLCFIELLRQRLIRRLLLLLLLPL